MKNVSHIVPTIVVILLVLNSLVQEGVEGLYVLPGTIAFAYLLHICLEIIFDDSSVKLKGILLAFMASLAIIPLLTSFKVSGFTLSFLYFILALIWIDRRIIKNDAMSDLAKKVKFPLTLSFGGIVYILFVLIAVPTDSVILQHVDWRLILSIFVFFCLAYSGVILLSIFSTYKKHRRFPTFSLMLSYAVFIGFVSWIGYDAARDLLQGPKKFRGYCYVEEQWTRMSLSLTYQVILVSEQEKDSYGVTPLNRHRYKSINLPDAVIYQLIDQKNTNGLYRCKYPIEVTYLDNMNFALQSTVLKN